VRLSQRVALLGVFGGSAILGRSQLVGVRLAARHVVVVGLSDRELDVVRNANQVDRQRRGRIVKINALRRRWPTGLAAGPLKYFISIDNTQKWFWNTGATTITQYWGTTAYPNGTHSVTVRVTDTAGKTATSTLNVLVRN
jgi:hypothetical protein